ncbi:hypothetical protein K488DRAFT_84891 [Vararia minispora EC-137]|uniref:Uncharacterized protein n=1 Tax=Vararia minispora EC-137 TaxID=1314806 RepID=A0ACB8QNU3_9AGAM|nr:hypothetical protein K488DRAFT_84891 [Vararia minispora EC-137]
MDNLRFVLEAPHMTTQQKKRPRLVTSCDNCRLKKIKCVQSRSQEKCEACVAGGVACEFRDRERYFAERSRIVTAGSSSSSAPYSRRSSRSPPYPSRSSGAVSAGASGEWYTPSPTPDPHQMRYMSNSPVYGVSTPSALSGDWFASGEVGSPSASSYFPSSRGGYNSFAMASGSPQSVSGSGYTPGLFDVRRSEFPDSALMPHYVQVFFQYYSRTFPFLSSSEVNQRLYDGSLSALQANAIAALAARYSQSPAVLERGASTAVNAYCDMARSLVSQSSLVPYIEILHAVILLAWADYKCGRSSNFSEYTQMATKMALSLGLGSESSATGISENERAVQRSTWATVLQLQQQLGSGAPALPSAAFDRRAHIAPPKLSAGASTLNNDVFALHAFSNPTSNIAVYL